MELRFVAGTQVYGRMHVYIYISIYVCTYIGISIHMIGMPRHCKQDVVTESGRSIRVHGEGCVQRYFSFFALLVLLFVHSLLVSKVLLYDCLFFSCDLC